ncbi:pentatricopeptide repeat-containing protein At1g74750-like [Andrographis paniculata]|uniref:pentatricopeptide repeat-containing protein At1g74750-like n=1 Tax=Andrographis paniculata TaxID=175694 RepID=UPI0021E81DA9|nr:pentatricopeptide repeat-containing protein At1g74750-like [Andrographis paniculata]XP_051136707.1 pentatricopeptide repeat-containing protein At1g74750-like [Andrographis paniculata]
MLRSKHLGTLSQSARSFFLNGSRCAADGSSCTCSEDETCISRRPLGANVHNSRPSASLLPKSSVEVSSANLIHTGKEVAVRRPENISIADGTCSSSRADPVLSNVDESGASKMSCSSSPPLADQFVKAGIAAVGLLSDLVNYKIPMTSGSAMLNPYPNSMVDGTKSISNIRSVNVRASKKDKVGVVPSGEPVSGSNSNYSSVSCATKGRPVKSVPSTPKSSGNEPNKAPGNCVEAHEVGGDRKRSVPRRPRSYQNRAAPNPSEGRLSVKNSDARSTRPTGVIPRAAPVARQYLSVSSVVERVSRILHQFNWGSVTEEALKNLDFLPDAFQANQVLKQLQDYRVAVGFFYWLKRQPGFKHDGHTYTTMVGILGRARQFGAINKLLGEMENDGCRPNVVTYNRLIHSYGKANYLSEAIGVFDQMQKIGCEPDRVTYCTLIDIHAKAGFLDVAMDMYRRMQLAGLSPDTFTYSVIINCLGKAGHLAPAHKLFCEMVEQGCTPNLVTYNIMIALHAKARNYQSALRVYRDMQNAGFEPDKVTYSIIMEVLGHCGFLDEAEAVFIEMKEKNWVPDEPVYGLLVDLWGKAGYIDKAGEWYQAMLAAGLRPNVPTCNSLLSAYLRVHRLHDAYDLLRSMVDLGMNPSLQTYTLLLSCCTEARESLNMSFCCRLMTLTGHPAHTFLSSMPSSAPDGQNVRDHVSTFLDMMHSEDRESKRGLVDAVIDFLHKTGLKEEAGSVWEVVAQKNVYPDAVKRKSSSYWLINLHVMSDGTAVTALSRTLARFRKEMLVSGVSPSRIDIVTGWGRRSRVTGTSLVRQAVEELLSVFRFPFFMENGNSGCFVGCGEPLNRWLLQPCVDRMHLL